MSDGEGKNKCCLSLHLSECNYDLKRGRWGRRRRVMLCASVMHGMEALNTGHTPPLRGFPFVLPDAYWWVKREGFKKRTGNDFWTLEVLIWMDVAWRKSKVNSHHQQE